MIFSLVHLKRVTERNKIVAFGKKKEAEKLRLEVENLQQKLQPDSDAVISDASVNDKDYLNVNRDEDFDDSSSVSSKSD